MTCLPFAVHESNFSDQRPKDVSQIIHRDTIITFGLLCVFVAYTSSRSIEDWSAPEDLGCGTDNASANFPKNIQMDVPEGYTVVYTGGRLYVYRCQRQIHVYLP